MSTAHRLCTGAVVGLLGVGVATGLAGRAPAGPPAAADPAPPATAAAPAPPEPAPSADPDPGGELTTVTAVVDGGTIEVAGGRTVRLLGLRACAPTTRGGREAAEFLQLFLRVGQQVRLVADGPRDADDRGRLLRRVEKAAGWKNPADPYHNDVGVGVVVHPAVSVATDAATGPYLARLRQRDYGPHDCSGTPAPR